MVAALDTVAAEPGPVSVMAQTPPANAAADQNRNLPVP
jgi:hypothetical protein